MSSSDTGMRVRLWEYPVWLLVTVPLLLIGIVLWIFGRLFGLVSMIGKRRTDG